MGILDIALTPFKSASNAVQNLTGEKSAKKEAQRNRDFQERLSSTAYTRAAKDLEAAGLNRVLAIGSPASIPSGGQAPIPNTLESMIGGAQAASGLATQKSQRKLMTQQTNQAQATAKAVSQRGNLDEQNARIRKTIADTVQTPDEFQEFLKNAKNTGMGAINSAIDADKWMQEQAKAVEQAVNDGLENFLKSINILPDAGFGDY